MPKSGDIIKKLGLFSLILILTVIAGTVPTGAAGAKTKATPSQPAENSYIVIDKTTKSLTLYIQDKPHKTYKVAIGKPESPTPVGEWTIIRKARHWGSGFGTRWMGLNVPWGLYGIHGTNKPWSIGGCESHGCIRMFNQDVEELYELVEKGAKVIILGEIFSPFYEDRRVLHEGIRGTDVLLLQQKLKEMGYLQGQIDGFFGLSTEAALKKFQKDHSFEVTGQVDADIYGAVGL